MREDKGCLGCVCPEGVTELSLGFEPISADLMQGASMNDWFVSRRDSTIVARHEYLFSVAVCGPKGLPRRGYRP